MEFEWDEAKSVKNQNDRGLSFADAAMMFDGPTLETTDSRRAYGEIRVKAIGQVDEHTCVVIYTDRQGVRRIISARRANRKEREQWRLFANP
jgi:uncharacterized DUF497 family protein